MIKFYYHPSPNPVKVALLLEEIGLPYEVVPVDTRKGEQFSSEFIAINPNGKTPAIMDDGVRVFNSTAILRPVAQRANALKDKFSFKTEIDDEARSHMFPRLAAK